MPTLLEVDGFRFVIWPRDHEPPHVHVFKAGREIKIALGDAEHRPRMLLSHGVSAKDATRALQLVAEHQPEWLEAWRRLHD